MAPIDGSNNNLLYSYCRGMFSGVEHAGRRTVSHSYRETYRLLSAPTCVSAPTSVPAPTRETYLPLECPDFISICECRLIIVLIE